MISIININHHYYYSHYDINNIGISDAGVRKHETKQVLDTIINKHIGTMLAISSAKIKGLFMNERGIFQPLPSLEGIIAYSKKNSRRKDVYWFGREYCIVTAQYAVWW